MIQAPNGYKFECSGRSFYANGYIGALLDKEDCVHIAEGYDGYIRIDEDSEDGWLTQDEINELSDYMIGLWTKFKKQ